MLCLAQGRNLRLRKEHQDLRRFVQKLNVYEGVFGVLMGDLSGIK